MLSTVPNAQIEQLLVPVSLNRMEILSGKQASALADLQEGLHGTAGYKEELSLSALNNIFTIHLEYTN